MARTRYRTRIRLKGKTWHPTLVRTVRRSKSRRSRPKTHDCPSRVAPPVVRSVSGKTIVLLNSSLA
jgi:hypothetical protein